MSSKNLALQAYRSTLSIGNVSRDTVLTTLSDLSQHDALQGVTQKHVNFESSKFRVLSKWRKLRELDWMRSIVWWLIVFPLTCFVIWSMTYILFGPLALPGGSLFALALLELTAIILETYLHRFKQVHTPFVGLGHVAELMNVPSFVGMTCGGLLVRNAPYMTNIGLSLDLSLTNPLRAMSVVVLLTRGAFGVNPTLIKKHKWVIPQLYIGACVSEAIAGSLAVYFLIGFPLQWSVAIGCIFSAMSGAGVMSYLLSIEKSLLGGEHDVMTIAKEGCGLDAILAINLTELAYGFIFANGELIDGIMKGAVQVLMGGAFGLFWGGLAGVMIDKEHGRALQTFILFCGGSMSLLGLTKLGYPRGGPFGCFFGSFVVSCIWRQKEVDNPFHKEVNANFTTLWYFFQPLLFGIIGSRIDFNTVDWTVLLIAIFCLTISILVRMCASFCSLCFAHGLTKKEKLFVVIAWLPKGTVQAALGPVLLETAISLQSGREVEFLAYKVMSIAVMVILVAPTFGGLLLTYVGPKLLQK